MLRTWFGSTARSFQWFGFGWQGRMTLHWNLERCSSRILDACHENMSCSKRIESYNQCKVVRTRCQSLEPAKTSSIRFSPGGVTIINTPWTPLFRYSHAVTCHGMGHRSLFPGLSDLLGAGPGIHSAGAAGGSLARRRHQ